MEIFRLTDYWKVIVIIYIKTRFYIMLDRNVLQLRAKINRFLKFDVFEYTNGQKKLYTWLRSYNRSRALPSVTFQRYLVKGVHSQSARHTPIHEVPQAPGLSHARRSPHFNSINNVGVHKAQIKTSQDLSRNKFRQPSHDSKLSRNLGRHNSNMLCKC